MASALHSCYLGICSACHTVDVMIAWRLIALLSFELCRRESQVLTGLVWPTLAAVGGVRLGCLYFLHPSHGARIRISLSVGCSFYKELHQISVRCLNVCWLVSSLRPPGLGSSLSQIGCFCLRLSRSTWQVEPLLYIGSSCAYTISTHMLVWFWELTKILLCFGWWKAWHGEYTSPLPTKLHYYV